MASLAAALPKPKNNYEVLQDPLSTSGQQQQHGGSAGGDGASGRKKKPAVVIPPYGQRHDFVPRAVEDFGDGGAFPEIHVPQFPLNMGKKGVKDASAKDLGTVALTVDEHGEFQYDAVIKQGSLNKQIVQSKHADLLPKVDKDVEIPRPDEDETKKTLERTSKAIEKVLNNKLQAAQLTKPTNSQAKAQYIKYTPTNTSAAHNSGASQRVIRLIEAQVDPLEPPKFKHKKVPKGPGSPPVPVLHSPPRGVSSKDQKDWKIPPCISNWKNNKGYTIPLDKRLAADGRGLQEVQINDKFANLSEALYVAEQKAREAVETRAKIQKEILLREKDKREADLRALAQRARMERTGALPLGSRTLEDRVKDTAAPDLPAGVSADFDDDDRSPMNGRGRRGNEDRDDDDDNDDDDQYNEPRGAGQDDDPHETAEERQARMKRDMLREERRRERERERRLAEKGNEYASKRSKISRDRDRDIGEKIALGQANIKATGEALYDQRLFNQDKGMSAGFGADEDYNLYDKELFTGSKAGSGLYRPTTMPDDDVGGQGESVNRMLQTSRFKANKGFEGTEGSASGPRDGPVQFERLQDEADPFGVDQFLSSVSKGRKAMDGVGKGNQMHAGSSGGYR